MILLTKLDRSKILVNLDAIKYIESTPDTLIFFLNGDSLLVRESLDELRQAVTAYYSQLSQQIANLDRSHESASKLPGDDH